MNIKGCLVPNNACYYPVSNMNDNWVRCNTRLKEKFKIKKVIFNNPATIVFWSDGTKTVVKCKKEDTWDPEKGLAMAICKKFLGENFHKEFKKWLNEYNKDFSNAFNDTEYEINKVLDKALDNVPSDFISFLKAFV